MKTYTLSVIDVKRETSDTITLVFKQPGLRKIKYLAGQYLTLIFRINGRRYLRPYSFSSCPTTDVTLDVTVKRVHNGLVSNHIHDMVSVGDSIEVLEPMGDFGSMGISEGDIYLWGVGSGITPLISMAKDILIQKSGVKVHLLYGNRDLENTIFLELIKTLQSLYNDRFNVIYFYTQLSVEPELPMWVRGRITKESIVKILQNQEIQNCQHYICGPLGLKDSLISTLIELGFPRQEIFSEDFELIKDPKDFVDIHTRTVKLKFEHQDINLEVVKGKGILESALDAGVDLPYSCQTGNCSTCKAEVLHGQVKMIGLEKERVDLRVNETLLCCSYPVSDDVVVKI
ncbi:FAD-binding oxidoreductase [Sphingobacterium anhuiense]|uniref:FAD-binding oxidoreductase n=1 Tax=Sphingobacterium anhuiense TaxID=493780 RepID=UPI003C302847